MREELESVFESINHSEIQRSKGIGKKIILTLIALIALVYLYSLMFGNYSWSIVDSLRKEKAEILEQTNKLQGENVLLQKMIFELKGLEPSSEEQE